MKKIIFKKKKLKESINSIISVEINNSLLYFTFTYNIYLYIKYKFELSIIYV